jgi:hypothetical protein
MAKFLSRLREIYVIYFSSSICMFDNSEMGDADVFACQFAYMYGIFSILSPVCALLW